MRKSTVILILVPVWVNMCFLLIFGFWHLNMICLGVHFWYLSFLVFCGLPGSVVWCLSLILENSQPLLVQIFPLFLSFFLLFLVFPLCIYYTFRNCFTIIAYSIFFIFFFLHSIFRSFYLHIFKLTDSFFNLFFIEI